MLTKMLQSILSTGAPSTVQDQSGAGGLYVTQQENGSYQALKILKIDEHGVHLRLYSNTFSQLPQSIEESTLYLAGIGRKPGEPMGMGHLPVSGDSFEAWHAHFIQQSTVSPDELDGYEIWKESEGGYF